MKSKKVEVDSDTENEFEVDDPEEPATTVCFTIVINISVNRK